MFIVYYSAEAAFLFVSFYRESFPNDLQFTILMRFTVDQTQTPNLKVSADVRSVCEVSQASWDGNILSRTQLIST